MNLTNIAVIESIVEQHAEEAAFLWILRDAAVQAPHYSLNDLADLDERVEAHIDGLRIAEDVGWSICADALAQEEPGEVFAAAILAFESGQDQRIKMVLEAGARDLELSRGLISALGWLRFDQVKEHIVQLLRSLSPELRRIGIAAFAVHRQDPGSTLVDALNDEDTFLKARAIRAVGELGRIDLLPMLKNQLAAKDKDCQFWAAWSAVLLGDRGKALEFLKTLAISESPFRESALNLTLRVMDNTSVQNWLKEMSQQPDWLRYTMIRARVAGNPVRIPWIVEHMEVPELARVAGEAFTMITGIDIVYEDLEGESPENFEAGPTESPEDEDVEMDPDEDLPWPEPKLIREWWDNNMNAFRNGTRYFLGQPISPEHLYKVLRTGFQRQQAAASLELAICNQASLFLKYVRQDFGKNRSLG
ncbi:MAG: TIGR02270 family protein [Candidatus Thermoplasmatota archaeon]|nr:TIGR02270 family protein [Candidatus Thermoplasmatota archaeon]